MIQISELHSKPISTLKLSEFEQGILAQKERSPETYYYNSLEALDFELKMRTSIVEAATALNFSGVDFAVFERSRCNEQFWVRAENGGFQLRPDVLPSDAINDIFQQGKLYAFECSAAIVIILYKATLDMIKKEAFNAYFQDLFIWDWNYDSDLKLVAKRTSREVYPGDILYFKNPDHDPQFPEWQGENVILLANDLYYGHGIGIRSKQAIIDALNKARAPGSTTSAFLTEDVIHPDFEYLRGLAIKDHFPMWGNREGGTVVVAKIGNKVYVAK
ncbi:protein-glutamine gamma-glutamyltransferase [Paenibacillus sp. ACRRX]|uniref:protein-glutamine gamma-glutamyltransferase n=1 Tax=Paenibacillus sp. ACRRX TaxID=2918206 RepID=UPI001EF408AB|nr:protein-glutamine gamma-glutamyltransferase [Paenibacillus sp. ACRRX]MCG7408754.1 protein-glutamine gamma-glutamyltransferase [Paenibacillus sp. ACRRX]